MRVPYHIEVEDLEACQAHVASQYRADKENRRRRLLLGLPLGMLLGLYIAWLLSHGAGHREDWRIWIPLGTAAFFIIFRIATHWWARSDRLKLWMQQFAGDYEMTMGPGGATVTSHGRSWIYSWQYVRALEETPRFWLLYLRSDVALPVPKSALPGETSAEFAAELRRLWAAHPENQGLQLPELPSEPAPGVALRRVLGDNLLAGLRLACWRPVSPADFRAGSGPLIWLLMLQLSIYSVSSYLLSRPQPVFNIYGLTAYAGEVLLFMLGGFAISVILVNRDSLQRLWVMLLAGLLVVDVPALTAYTLVLGAVENSPAWIPWMLYLVSLVWSLLVVFRVVRLLYRQPVPSAWLMAFVFAFFNVALPASLPQQQVFYPDYAAGESDSRLRAIDAEATFYRQPQLVSRALSFLQPQRPGTTDLYFVGFAGQADEKVFTNEVRYARGLLERRFGAAGRSLALLNNIEALPDTPLANTHNLEMVLQGLAERMDRQEDVLFLFLTSHGARDRSLSVSFWPLQMNDLKAEKLKQILDRSGIRNRVIVVSACYSGGFLDVLKDDYSLVLTASSRDHVSYGCGDATEYTYFGESYFVKALARDNSFVSAFDTARSMIEAREKSEGKEASSPQIYIGSNIRQKLERLAVDQGRSEQTP